MKKSFTLIELIVVIAIIAILAAIIAPNAVKAIEKAKVSEAIGDYKTYKTAIYALYADTGHWIVDSQPGVNWWVLLPDNNDLTINHSNWSGWDGPYLEKIKGKHPWGGSYLIDDGALVGWLPSNTIVLDLNDWGYPSGPDYVHPLPYRAAIKMDQTIDDGNLTTGEFWCRFESGKITDCPYILLRR